MGRAVEQVLQASQARQLRACALGRGLRLVQWANQDDYTEYHAPGHHTLSVYLAGGYRTHVAQRPDVCGAPGRICVLPADHESRWVVRGQLAFVHLYVSNADWAERVVRLLDAEPRSVSLAPRLLEDDDALAQWGRVAAGLDWQDVDARLQVEAHSHAVLDQLLLTSARPALRGKAMQARGGLSSVARRRVLDWVDCHLAEPLSIADMAAVAALSPFHFARMFRCSMGVAPHTWVAQRRLARARTLLSQSRLPLAQVAALCGYASASHLSLRVAATFGVSPTQYRILTRA